MTMLTPATVLNYQPLSAPVTHAEREAYLKQTGNKSREMGVLIAAIVIAIIAIIIVGSGTKTGASGLFTGAIWLCVTLFVVGIVYWISYHNTNNAIRAMKFAAANGFSYVPGPVSGDQAGSIWRYGSDRHEEQMLVGTFENRPFEFGTHAYVTGEGRDRATHFVTFMRVALPRMVPHVLVDARRDVLELGAGIDRSQRLSLEGDFDKYFTVYCPDNYQEDVLYFLTPELMQSMIDNDRAYDMEVVGDQLYFYRQGLLKYDAQTIEHLFLMLHTTGGEFAENTRLYKDDRSDALAGAVAAEGMTLRRHVTTGQAVAMVFLGLYVLFVISRLFTNF